MKHTKNIITTLNITRELPSCQGGDANRTGLASSISWGGKYGTWANSKVFFLFAVLLFAAPAVFAQSYKDSMVTFRKKYLEELLAEKRQPVKPSQAGKISFFPPNAEYRVIAEVKETPGTTPFMIPTHSGKQKPFREYCTLTFTIKGTQYTLHAYQGMDLIKDTVYKDHLFIPFRDRTNYDATYGGGRYIDLSIKDIAGGRIELDLNKAYNPYCAYADGFNCPIPPDENSLPIEIPAGEKTFVH